MAARVGVIPLATYVADPETLSVQDAIRGGLYTTFSIIESYFIILI